MKKVRKVMSWLMVLAVMLIATLVPKSSVSAADTTYSLSINDIQHTYSAYQVFSGTLDSTKKELGTINWGTGVKGDTLLDDLKSAATATLFGGVNPFGSCTNAEDVAKVLVNDTNFTGTNKDKNLAIFASIVGKATNLSTTKKDGAVDSGVTKITELPAGYYLVVDTQDVSNTNDQKSRFILSVSNDTTIDPKVTKPTLDKKIVSGDDRVEKNTAGIGDTIKYEITSVVPDMTGYNKYFFIMNDVLSAGIDYNSDIDIKIAGDSGSLGSDDYEVTTTDVGGKTKIDIVFKDFKNRQGSKAGKAITVTYTGTLNEKAVTGKTGNPNEVTLTYSNDPTCTYTGTNEPAGDDVVGVIPKKEVITYTFKLKLNKVDATNESTKLTGAKFSLSGTSVKMAMVNEKIYEQKGDGTYYKLLDGTYTTTAPTAETKSKYEMSGDVGVKYALVDKVSSVSTPGNVSLSGAVDAYGVITFEKLGVGTFTINEEVAPDGYNKIAPFDVVITATGMDTSTPTFSSTVAGDAVAIGDDGIIEFNVKKNKGIVLPSTGGIGTKIFYVIGGLLVIVAGVLLITKKRMEKEN